MSHATAGCHSASISVRSTGTRSARSSEARIDWSPPSVWRHRSRTRSNDSTPLSPPRYPQSMREARQRSRGLDARVERDAERRALAALADRLPDLPERHSPDQALQIVVDLARDLTLARYGALAVTDRLDRVEGFVVAGLESSELMRLRTPPQGHGPLGSLREDGRPVRFDDVQQHAKAFGFPSHHPEMTALVGVAIWVNGEVRGALYVTDRGDGEPFDRDDERVLTTLAAHAATIIETEWY
ncbi:MAG: GAF domain-containing protein [Dehalococcoidia bacterium]|nr:MAG: GAF domain-containing protein [Dehalococcoidia bacterium]